MKKLLISLAFTLLGIMYCIAQEPAVTDTTHIYRVETLDGNTFVGTLAAQDNESITIRTEKLGAIRILKNDIRTQILLSSVRQKDGQYWLPNPQSSRYFWAPNGYGLAKGESYYQNIWVFYNQFTWGLTNHFSLSAGTIPLFLFSGTSTPIWLVPKFSIPVTEDKFNIGTGAFVGTVLGEDTGVFGLLFGTATFGSKDKNVSLGVAQGFSTNGFADIPVFNISTLNRTGPRGYFISENYLIIAEGEVGVLLSVGGRSIIRNIGLDYSVAIPFVPDMDSFLVLPFLGITVPMGKNR